jgi:adenosylmethionine-8-amino-7-oxononanoate aminotransferase
MSHILHRSLDETLPTANAGEGSFIIDEDGRRYLDGCGGAAVSCIGHSETRVQEAICHQVRQLAYVHSGAFTNRPAEDLATYLVTNAPEGTGDGRVLFLGSGSEAMEAALKLCRQYHVERGEPERSQIISRRGSYHGNTLGALAVGGHAARRAPYEPLLMPCEFIDPCYEYRFRLSDETEDAFGHRMANQLEDRILAVGPDRVAAFVAEPVVGATLGSQPAAKGYFRRIREICDRYGVLFIADEVMCGVGRTGSFFALEQEGVAADIVTLAKGLGAGYLPIAALIASERVCDSIRENSGRLWNGHTYMSHSVACAGALAVLDVMEKDSLVANVRVMGRKLEGLLRVRFGDHKNVGDLRGRGLFWSIEFVQDRVTKAPFDVSIGVAVGIQAIARRNGLMCYASQGCADGIHGDHILLAPSYATTSEELEMIVDLLAESIGPDVAA